MQVCSFFICVPQYGLIIMVKLKTHPRSSDICFDTSPSLKNIHATLYVGVFIQVHTICLNKFQPLCKNGSMHL